MKKILRYLAAASLVGLFFVSCTLLGKDFDASLLYSGSGEWVSNQTISGEQHEIHDKFLSNGTGSTWSVTDGAPPQPFTWELSGERLTFLHQMEMGGTVPKDYTVVTLTETRLVYRDGYGVTITCTKKP